MVRTNVGCLLSETSQGAAELERVGSQRMVRQQNAAYNSTLMTSMGGIGGNRVVAPLAFPQGMPPPIIKNFEPAGLQKPSTPALESPKKPQRPSAVFSLLPDQEAMKQKVKQQLCESEPYNVSIFYYSTGLWQKIARHPWFENITLGVISLNALWMWIDTDYNDSESLLTADPLFQVMEQFFAVYFCFEWVVRFMAFKNKLDGRKDGWFVFDSALVLLMFVETWVFSIVAVAQGSYEKSPLGDASTLRLLRLLRLSRLLRMLRGVPEIMVLLKGIATAMNSVVYVMGLLLMICYVFGIAFTQLAGNHEVLNEFFSSVPISVYSLFIYATFLDDLAYFCDSILEHNWYLYFILVPFIAIACLTVMNMLVGVLCEVVCAVAATEKEEILTRNVQKTLIGILEGLDKDGNGTISFEEFKRLVDFPEAIKAVTEVGVDPVSMVNFAEIFFIEDGEPKEITFGEFLELVLDLRGSNKATVKDIMNLSRQISGKMTALSENVGALTKKTKTVEEDLQESTNRVNKQLDSALQTARHMRGKFAARRKSVQ